MAATATHQWMIKERKLGLGKYNTTTTNFDAPAGVVEVNYYGPAYAKHFTENLDEESQIPKHLQRAVIAGALRDYYEEKVNKTESDTINQRIWSGVYRRLVTRGREYTTLGKQAGFLQVQPSQYL